MRVPSSVSLPSDHIYRTKFGEIALLITKVQNDQTLNLVYSRMALLYNCFRTVKGKKALLCVLKVYQLIRLDTSKQVRLITLSGSTPRISRQGSMPIVQALHDPCNGRQT